MNICHLQLQILVEGKIMVFFGGFLYFYNLKGELYEIIQEPENMPCRFVTYTTTEFIRAI
jgi:hypothetical protein